MIDAGSYALSAVLTVMLWKYPLLDTKAVMPDASLMKGDVELQETSTAANGDVKSNGEESKERGLDTTTLEVEKEKVSLYVRLSCAPPVITVAPLTKRGSWTSARRSFLDSLAMFRDGFIYLWNHREIFVIAHMKVWTGLVSQATEKRRRQWVHWCGVAKRFSTSSTLALAFRSAKEDLSLLGCYTQWSV